MWCRSLVDVSLDFVAAAPSRRAKLESLPPSHLLLLARNAMFGGSYNRSPSHIVKVLQSAAVRGNEEARWLLDTLTRDGPVVGELLYGGTQCIALGWLADIMSREDSPRAHYYRGRALLRSDRLLAAEALRRSADGGFAPAMAELVVCLVGQQVSWLRKSAELNDPDGLYLLSFHDKQRHAELRNAAASRGHVESLLWVSMQAQTSHPLKFATLRARFMLLQGGPLEDTFHHLSDHLERVREDRVAPAASVQFVFNVGRELEGYEQFWDTIPSSGRPEYRASIDVYLLILHRARRAALQTIVALRALGVPRDIALLIAKLVCASPRDEAGRWMPIDS